MSNAILCEAHEVPDTLPEGYKWCAIRHGGYYPWPWCNILDVAYRVWPADGQVPRLTIVVMRTEREYCQCGDWIEWHDWDRGKRQCPHCLRMEFRYG